MTDIPIWYKQTEIGIIPNDWDNRKLDDFLDLLTDYDANWSFADMANNVSTKIWSWYARYVRATDLEQNTEFSKVRYADYKTYKFLKKTSLFGEEVLVAKRWEIWKVYFFKKKTKHATLWPNLYLLKLKDNIINKFLYYYLVSDPWQKSLVSINASTSLWAIYKNDVKNLQIPNPPLPEQQAIATTLSDMDELISNLDELIEKKKNIKLWTMQKLLTGKIRLPGFTWEWEEKELWELLAYEQPTNYLVKSTEYDDWNSIPVLTAGKTFILWYTNEKFWIYDKWPVIIFDDFTTESKFVDFPFKAKSSAMKMLTLRDKDMSLKLVNELMQIVDFEVWNHQRHWIWIYSKLKIKLPRNKEEQQAIAAALSDMDKEIETLEEKKAKYEQIKQWAMQQLLTWKIRLV